MLPQTRQAMVASTNTSSDREIQEFGIGTTYPEVARICLICLGFFYVLIGIPGNTLIIYTIHKVKSLRVRLNVFVVNLAVADLVIVGFFAPFHILDLLTGKYPVSPTWCSFNAITNQCLALVSQYSVASIAISRYTKVCHGQRYDKIFTRKSTVFICAAPWVIGAVSASYHIYDPSDLVYIPAQHVCISISKSSPMFFILMVLIPTSFSTATVCYVKLWQHTRNSEFRLRRKRNNMFSRLRHDVNKNMVMSNLVIFVLYILFYLPVYVLRITKWTGPKCFQGIAVSLVYANSAINCIVYGVMNKKIRKSYRQIMPLVQRWQDSPCRIQKF